VTETLERGEADFCYVVAMADEHSTLITTQEDGLDFLHTFEALDCAYDWEAGAEEGLKAKLCVLKMKKDDIEWKTFDGKAEHLVGKRSPVYLKGKW